MSIPREGFFQPVRKNANECWHKAFRQFNICHRIDAKELANLRHDAASLQFGLNFGRESCLNTHLAANSKNRSPELTG